MRRFSALRKALASLTTLALLGAPLAMAGCEAIGMKANITTVVSQNGKTTVKQREAKNWGEFKEAMGEVSTDFSNFAKEVGATTADLVKKLVDVPPPGKVTLSSLEPSLGKYEGNVRYDYLKVAAMKPNAEYDFTYVQIGMREYDDFFKAAAEMYGCAYQLTETARHVRLTTAALTGTTEEKSAKVEELLAKAAKVDATGDNREMTEYAKDLDVIWKSVASLGAKFVGKTAALVKAGAALVASAPRQITNPKLVLHIKLIVKGLNQSVGFVKDTTKLLGDVAGLG